VALTLAILPNRSHASVPIQASPAARTNEINLASEVIRLIRGQASPDVVRAYIASWSQPFLTSIDDLVRMRRAGASPDILDAYSRRGAQLRLQSSMAEPATRDQPQVLFYPAPVYPDALNPESTRSSLGSIYLFSDNLPGLAEAYAWEYNWPFYFWWPPLGPFALHRR
jgi:hypothetical protein